MSKRYLARKGTLSPAQEEALAAIPQLEQTWDHGDRVVVSPQRQWRLRFQELHAWQALHGTLPKQSQGGRERSLANWLAKCVQFYRKGKLRMEQISDLREVPGVFERRRVEVIRFLSCFFST